MYVENPKKRKAQNAKPSNAPTTAAAAPSGKFFGTPTTYFPQYSMAGMFPQLPQMGNSQYNYSTGVWGPGSPPPAQQPTTPPPSGMLGNSQLRSGLQGLFKTMQGNKPDVSFSTLNPEQMALLTQGWGLFGGDAAMPTSEDPYRQVYDRYKWPA